MTSFFHKQAPVLLSVLTAFFLIIGFGTAGAATPSQKTNAQVPTTLQAIESNAEDIIDLAGTGGWTQVLKKVASISNSWAIYRKQAAGIGLSESMKQSFDSALKRLERESAAKNRDATMQSANDLSAVVVDMYGLYNPAIPADVGRLDVLERQVVLDTKAGKWDAAEQSLAKVKIVWDRLKPSVETHHGANLTKQFQENLLDQTMALQARNKTILVSQANHALDLVDGLEKLYE